MSNAWNSLVDAVAARCERIENRIAAAAASDESSLAIYRVVVGFFVLAFGCKSTVWQAELPQGLFLPHRFNVVALFDGFPPKPVLAALDVAMILAALALTVGFRTRASTWVLALTIFCASAVNYAMGKITHDVLYPLLFVAMATTDWGRYLSVDAWLRTRNDPAPPSAPSSHCDLRFLSFCVAAGFATAGVPKALNWLDLDTSTSGTLRWLYLHISQTESAGMLGTLAARIASERFWELTDIAAVAFELSALVCIAGFLAWRAWLTVACVFHLLNCLVLNISFFTNSVVYVAFAPWARFFPSLDRRTAPPTAVTVVACILALANLWLLESGPTRGGLVYKLLGQPPYEGSGLVVSCLLWAAGFAILAAACLTPFKPSNDPRLARGAT